MPAPDKLRGLFACALIASCAACSLMTSFDGFGGSTGDAGSSSGGSSSSGSTSSGSNSASSSSSSGATSSSGSASSSGGTTSSGSTSSNSSSGGISPGMDAAADSSGTDSSVVDSGVADTTVADSPADTMGPDSSPADTGTPPTDAAKDAPSSWCATQPSSLAFCDDFDENPLAVGFDSVESSNCTIGLAAGKDTSPPNAMSAVSKPSLTTVGCQGVKAFPSLGATPTTYTLAFDIYPVQVDQSNNSEAVAAAIVLGDSAGVYWWLQFDLTWDTFPGLLMPNLDEVSDLLDGGEPVYANGSATPLPMNQWTRVTMTLTVGAHNVPQSATLSLGSSQVVSATLHPTTTNPTLSLELGYSYIAPGNASWSMLYDNVTLAAN